MPYRDGYLLELTLNIGWFTRLKMEQSSLRSAGIIIKTEVSNQTSGDRIQNPDF